MSRAKKKGFRNSTRAVFGLGGVALLCCAQLVSGCDSTPASEKEGGSSGDGDEGGDGDTTAGTGGAMSDIEIGPLGGSDGQAMGGAKSEVMIITELPDGFVEADAFGGWDVVGAVEDVPVQDSTDCANVLRVIARDFPESHPDFQRGSNGLYPGIVLDTIGEDRKPVLADLSDPGDLVESEESFNQWYRNVEGENLAFVMDLWLEPVGETFVFDSASFFPLDELGYALVDGGQGQSDGFHFTTELHTRFQYQGGETFTFRGDDDVWVFINGQLAIDIGGVHGAEEASVDIDSIATEFGLTVGEVYTLDLFQAERQTTQSNFRIETTLDFTGCGEILPDDIPVK